MFDACAWLWLWLARGGGGPPPSPPPNPASLRAATRVGCPSTWRGGGGPESRGLGWVWWAGAGLLSV
eukprot:693885-Rhodomonas_salina.5